MKRPGVFLPSLGRQSYPGHNDACSTRARATGEGGIFYDNCDINEKFQRLTPSRQGLSLIVHMSSFESPCLLWFVLGPSCVFILKNVSLFFLTTD